MPLYKYVTINTLKRILDGRIRFTQPSAFNDPFELLPEIYYPPSIGDRKISIRFSLQARRRAKGEVEANPEHDTDDCNDLVSREIIKELNSSIGILSLTQNDESLLMWSHYADQYKGALIEFDDAHSFFCWPIEVEYRSKRPKKHISYYIEANEPIPVAELCVKSQEWAYEKEVRVVLDLRDCKKDGECNGFPIYVMGIPSEAIKTVTFGERTPVDQQRDVWTMLKDTRIALGLAAISFSGYGFRKETIKFGVPVSDMGPAISPRTAHIFLNDEGDLGEIARWTIANDPLSKAVNKPI